MENTGEQFLHKKNPSLHTTPPVEMARERTNRNATDISELISQKPADKIANWLDVIKHTHTGHREDPRVLERIKESYYKEYVIKPEDIPESYFDTQKRLARELGHGDVEITDEQRKQLTEVIISDQKSTLDNWINYFTHPDADVYPMWAKHWAFTNVVKLSTFDKEKHEFGKRDKGTVAPFPDLNREALAYVVDAITKQANGENIGLTQDNPELKKLLDGSNFGKLYTYAIEKVTPTEENELAKTEGEWVKYDRKSDHMPLVQSLQGYGTGWCTVGESTAQIQLQGGDFYVYYSYDKQGKPTIPRVAIRMSGNKIGEIRGVAEQQNLDPYINDVVIKKLDEFPDGKEYQKKSSDMKRLTEIDNRYKEGQEPTKDELRFLYEIDSKIQGFGYDKDPRIEEILDWRDVKSDLSQATGFSEDQISTTHEEALSGNIKFHYGDLNLSSLTSAEFLKLPVIVGGDLDLSKLISTDDLKLPETIGGSLRLDGLTSADDLKLPETIDGTLRLDNLISAVGLKLPKNIGGGLWLQRFINLEGITLPETIGGNIYLPSLTSAEFLKLPETINGDLYLGRLTSTEYLKLPKNVGGELSLWSLTSTKGLILPETVGGGLDLSYLTSADGLKLPKTIGGYLALSGITSAVGLTLPENVSVDLHLESLTSIEGLTLPKNVEEDLYLSALTSIEGLTLPENVGGDFHLESLSSAEKDELRKKHPYFKIV